MAISVISTTGDVYSTDTSSMTVSNTVASGDNRLLLVIISCYSPSSHPTGVTYNSDAMTKVFEQDGAPGHTSGWILKAPDVGTYNVVATWGSDVDDVVMGIANFTGVNQTTPTGTAVYDAAAYQTPVTLSFTSATNEIVVGALTHTNIGWTADVGQTDIYDNDLGGVGSHSSYKTGDTAVSLEWTNPSSRWSMGTGISIKPAVDTPFGTSNAMFFGQNF